MKILQVVPYFYPAWAYGGPGKLVYDTSQAFTKRGHNVTVYSSDAYDADSRIPEKNKVSDFTVHYFRNLSNSLAFHSNIYLPMVLFFRVPFELRSYDVIHIHDFYTLANIWITLWARLYRIPYIISVHGCLELERRRQKSSFKKYFLRFFGRSMLTHASTLIATSANEVSAYKSFDIPADKIVRIGHGVDRSEFETKKTKRACRFTYKIPQNAFVFTFIGRLHPIKGVDLLLDAFAKSTDPRAFLIIAGSDEGLLSQLQQHVKGYHLEKKVKFFGPVFGRQKAEIFRATDVFVYPSRSEGFSLGILEAASVGLPLLITKACHFNQVQKEDAGIVVDVNATAIADGLKRWSSLSKDQIRHMSEHAANLIAHRYSMTAICNKLESTYEHATQSK